MAGPAKVIHDPNSYEVKEMNEILSRMGFVGPIQGVLLMGEKVFDQYWVSSCTRGWLRQCKLDLSLWQECSDAIESRILHLMIELDYVAVMLSLHTDAVQVTVEERLKRSKSNAWS